MTESKNELSTKSKLKRVLKRLFTFFIFFLIIGFIVFIIFYNFFETDGFTVYPEYNVIKNYSNLLKTVKNLYYRGKYIDAYNISNYVSYISTYPLKEHLIESYKYDHNIRDEDEEEEDDDDNDYYDEEENEKSEINKNTKNNIVDKKKEEILDKLKLEYEINLLNYTSEIMKNKYKTKINLPSSYLTLINKVLPKKMQIEINYMEQKNSYRIFKKHNSIPEIYNYANEISNIYKTNFLHKIICAKLYLSCGDYKDSKKLSVNLINDLLFKEVLSIKYFNLDTSVSVYIPPKYLSVHSWSEIISSDNLIDYIYYYRLLGGNIKKLKSKFNKFIKTLYEEAEKDYNEVVSLKTKYDLQKSSLNNKKNLKKINLIRNRLKNAYRKYQYLDSLKELNYGYYITKFEIDSEYINNSVNCLKECKFISEEIEEIYKNLKNSLSEEDDEDE